VDIPSTQSYLNTCGFALKKQDEKPSECEEVPASHKKKELRQIKKRFLNRIQDQLTVV
jgi:hypothetical protein